MDRTSLQCQNMLLNCTGSKHLLIGIIAVLMSHAWSMLQMRAAWRKLMAPGTDALAAGLGICSCWIREAMLSGFSVNRCSIYSWLAATMPGHRLVDLKLLQQATLLSQADCDLLAAWGEHSLQALAPSHPFARWFKLDQLELSFHHLVSLSHSQGCLTNPYHKPVSSMLLCDFAASTQNRITGFKE